MNRQPLHRYECATCGGPAMRRTNVALPLGFEDADAPLLHVRTEDWVDAPHDVDGIDKGVRPYLRLLRGVCEVCSTAIRQDDAGRWHHLDSVAWNDGPHDAVPATTEAPYECTGPGSG